MKVAVYYRVSTDLQQTASQRGEVDTYLAKHNITNPIIFEDLAISGATTKRPGYQALLKAVAYGEIDMVITYALDRVSRNSSEAINTILTWRRAGVRFVSVTQPHLSTDTDQPFHNTILAAQADLAQMERGAIVNRIKSGIKAKRKANDGAWGRRNSLDEEGLDKLQALRDRGFTLRQISTQLGISLGTVHNSLNRLKHP